MESELVDVLLVLVKRRVSGSEELFVRAKVLLRSFNLVHKGLKLDGVSVGSFKLGLVAERDVFKTVDLTETPDEGIEISSTALDSENFLQIGVLSDSLHHLIEEFRLGKWVSGVGSEVVSVFILLRLVRTILFTLVEETEAAHQVSLSYLHIVRSTIVSLGSQTEESGGHLGAEVVEKRESSNLSTVTKPRLAEKADAVSELTLDGPSFVSCETTTDRSPHGFSALDSHDLIDLFCVSAVIPVT